MELHEPTTQSEPFSYRNRHYVRAPRPIDFPSEERPEDKVSETKRHLLARTTLYLLLDDVAAGSAVGSDQFVYWDAGDPQKCLSPDVFVKLGSKDQDFDSWKIWERGAPDLAVEIVSDSDRSEAEWAVKLSRYQASGFDEVVRFDPAAEARPIRVWDRVKGELVERSPESATLRECGALGLWWVVAPSEHGPLLRLSRDSEGKKLLPTPSEDRIQLREELAEERKARAQAEHERMVAEHERMVAEREREAATAERDAVTAENVRLRAELARLRGER